MKFLRCSNNGRTTHYDSSGEGYCSAKLPCGRCVSANLRQLEGKCKPYMCEFDCEHCEFRFVCLTNGEPKNYEILELMGIKVDRL